MGGSMCNGLRLKEPKASPNGADSLTVVNDNLMVDHAKQAAGIHFSCPVFRAVALNRPRLPAS